LKRTITVPSITLDLNAPQNLYKQIALQIAAAIRIGEIQNGACLPSTRQLSKLLRVSRNTVLTAYDELAAEGLISGVQGAGMRVEYRTTAALNVLRSREIFRIAHFPARVVAMADPDGNPLYLNL
jgi:DNA-binding GntR family transcriptional regulator